MFLSRPVISTGGFLSRWPRFAPWVVSCVYEARNTSPVSDELDDPGVPDYRLRLRRALELKQKHPSRTRADIANDPGVSYSERHLRQLRRLYPRG